ncbi:MAG: sulfatase-like hydrolase/transferase, partial [Bacteroidales bacterium]|nr:sulfatase-like hydrolase/transferase [Bacteroidales bacterium]
YKDVEIPLAEDFCAWPMIPRGFPAGAIREINADVFINRRCSPEEAREALRAYWACISYVDWNVGRLIAALDEEGLADNTIIVFCVDHGMQMGEKGKWSKAGSLWEEGTNTPLVVVDPRAKANGKVTYRITENLDIYPTLVELCGLPAKPDLEGTSFARLLDDPEAEFDKPAYTVWNNHGKGVTGVGIRTERWRYAEYFGAGAGCMLIDEVNDPHELVNQADQPEHAELVARFHKLAQDYVKGQRELTKEEAGIR